jgi:diguanylate cyclase (GGDEF)-like protein/PAS domain S-box-containing protein
MMIAGRFPADDKLLVEQERASATLNSIGDGVISTDPSGTVTYLNPVAERLTGWSCKEAIGRRLVQVFNVVDARSRAPVSDRLELAIHHDKTVASAKNAILLRRDGIDVAIEDSMAPIRDRHARLTGAVIVFRDVTTARAREDLLSLRVQHDVLTDLPNRLLLTDRLEHAIAQARRRGTQVAVLFIDLDRFKDVNDSLGHAVGDRLLQEVAKRLKSAVRQSDTVGRLGGDEFVVVLSEIDNPQSAARQADKIRAVLAASPHVIGSQKLSIQSSIGTSFFPDDGVDATSLVNCADLAMYVAKRSGPNGHRFFAPDAYLALSEARGLSDAGRLAPAGIELSLHQRVGAHSSVEESLR